MFHVAEKAITLHIVRVQNLAVKIYFLSNLETLKKSKKQSELPLKYFVTLGEKIVYISNTGYSNNTIWI